MKLSHVIKAAALSALAAGLITAQENTPRPNSLPNGGIIVPSEIPSGSVPAACQQYLSLKTRTSAYSLIDCYLKDPSNSEIAWDISWGFNNQYTPWTQWPSWAKQDLANTFNSTVGWYKGGMVSYVGTLAPDPAPVLNQSYLQLGLGGSPVYDEATVAWPIYLGHVALNLASEMYGWVPWSLHNFNNEGLYAIFSFSNYFYNCTQGQYDAIGYCLNSGVTPANATFVLKFFKTNNLIGANKAETIIRYLDWARWNLNHSGGSGYNADFMYFGYWGPPPVSATIKGTVVTDPATPLDWKINPRHWIAGCGGMSYFTSMVLRAVNIPVTTVAAGGGHMAPAFISEKLYLSHGDDPYGQDMKSDAPSSMIPISKATYDAWFPANDPATAALNTGRRDVEINVTYPSKWTLDLYCSDIANGLDHYTGSVFNKYFYRFYTVPQLEQLGVWQRLDQKMQSYACAM